MTKLIRIRTEPCTICKKTLALSVNADELIPDITGLDLFLDLHGFNDDLSHARLLYIDSSGFVRSIYTITKFTNVLHHDELEK